MPGGLAPRRAVSAAVAHRSQEILDVLSPDSPSKIVGSSRHIEEIHRDGLYHKGSWVFSVDDQLRVLLVWRAPSMATCPGTWSVLGEHAVSGESFEQAAVRGMAEEAPFLEQAKLVAAGEAFKFQHQYNGSTRRVDNQWTRSFLALPLDVNVDFGAISVHAKAVLSTIGSSQNNSGTVPPPLTHENTRFQGMPLADVVRTALRGTMYFCNPVQSAWMVRSLVVAARILRDREPELYSAYLNDSWNRLITDGAPVCCSEQENLKQYEMVNLSRCGIEC